MPHSIHKTNINKTNHSKKSQHIYGATNHDLRLSSHTTSYPRPHEWFSFFDKALLIIGVVALALSVLFFIAYNWLYMGKITKFALVEGILIISILAYAFLAIKRPQSLHKKSHDKNAFGRPSTNRVSLNTDSLNNKLSYKNQLIEQILLLFASLMTGALLALFGQVYQTGADTWQLFFSWAVLIIPWVFLARMPAIWLLFLGLINLAISSYLPLSPWYTDNYTQNRILQTAILTLTNLPIFGVWIYFDKKHFYQKRLNQPSYNISNGIDANSANAANSTNNTINSSKQSTPMHLTHLPLHWSSYIVAILSTYHISNLAVTGIIDNTQLSLVLLTVVLWLIWCVAIYVYFRRRHVNVFMLTCLCTSIIAVLLMWVADKVLDYSEIIGFSTLFVLLVILSSAAMVWLRHIAHITASTSQENQRTVKGDLS